MAINPFKVSYDDFMLDQIIDPDEFDVNFSDIEIRVNQIIDVLNQITDGIGGSGAEIINIDEVLPFASTTLQTFLRELIEKLHESGEGAEFISSMPISGVVGSTVQQQLESLGLLLQQLQSDLDNEVIRINDLIAKNIDNITTLDERTTALEETIVTKANSSDVYTKTEVDRIADQVEAETLNQTYTKEQIDNTFTKITGNHEGTWQGLDVSDIARAIHAKDLIISNTQPKGTEGLLWFNPLKDEYTLFLNGQWRPTGRLVRYAQRLNRVVLDSDTNTVAIGIDGFDPDFDILTVHVNSTYLASSYDYTINGDNTITFPETLKSGTTVDFDARILTE